jgi:putative ABC transport system permease protein
MELLRNIARHKLRSFLTISGIVIGVLALTTMGALSENFNALLNGGVTYFGSSIQVGPPAGQVSNLLAISKIDEIKQVDGVAAAFPGYGFSAKPGQVTAVSFGVPDTIVAADPAQASYGAFHLRYAQGRPVNATATDEVVLGYTIDKEFARNIGDTIDLPVRPPDAAPDFTNRTYRVVGILDQTRTAPDNFAYISIPAGQQTLRDSLPSALRGTIDVTQVTEGITVYGKPGTSTADLDKLADRINAQVAGVKATKPSDLVNSFRSGGAIFTAITTAAALLALIIGGLSVVNTMFMAVAERVREIGLKKAVGATTFNIMGEFLLEATLIGVVGGLLGWGFGALIVTIANATTPPSQSTLFLLTPSLTAFAIGFAAALGALAGVLPAWRAARLDPVIALRNE